MEYQQQNYQQSINNLPNLNPSEKTILWQQPYIDSGYNTSAPSISSIDAFLNEDQMDTNIQPQQQNWNFPSNNKMIPQNIDNRLQQSQTQQQQQQQSDLLLLSSSNDHKNKIEQPAVESDNALQNWMNSQEDDEKTAKAIIPDLIKLLNDDDLVVVSHAAMLVNQMSKKKNACLALAETPDILMSLVNCLANDRNIETAKHVVSTFYNISMYPQGINSIMSVPNALQALVNLLSAQMETVVSYAITTLHNVLLACSEVKTQLRNLGSVQKMVPLLRHKNVKFLSIVIDCLQLIAHGHQDSKKILLEQGAPSLLIDILRTSQYPKLISMGMRLMKVLSVCSQNKKALISCDAMQVLSLHLKNSNSSELLVNNLITLRNLSDAATKINGLDNLMENLIKLVSSPNDGISITAAGVLSNLTCNNENNKLAVLKANGIPILLKVLETSYMKTDLIDPCICTLRHITNRHQEAIRAQEELKHYNGLTLITSLLTLKPYNWSIVKPILGVVRNFVTNLNQMQFLKSIQIIEKVMQILFDAYNEAQHKQVVNDVNLIDIIDSSANIVLLLMKDHSNQIHMKNINCISFFVQLLNTPHDKVQNIAAGLLAEMAQNKECIAAIDQQPGVHFYLSKIFSRQDGANNNLAKTILFHINEYKSMTMNRFMPPQDQWNTNNDIFNENPLYNQSYEQQQQHIHQSNSSVSLMGQDYPPQTSSQIQQPNIYQQPFDNFTQL